MPNRFQSLNPSSDLKAIVNQVNKNFTTLDQEAITKIFGSGDNKVVIGRVSGGAGLQVGDLGGSGIFYGRDSTGKIGTFQYSNGILVSFDGEYRSGRFGKIFYDPQGVPISLDGQAPDDGRMGHWFTPVGTSVITQLGG